MRKDFYTIFVARTAHAARKIPGSYLFVALILILVASFGAFMFLQPEKSPERARREYERLIRPLRTVDDGPFAFEELSGKVVLLNF